MRIVERFLLLVCLLIGACSSRQAQEKAAVPSAFPIMAAQQQTVVLDETAMDSILGDSTTVLRTSDFPGDVACPATLYRSKLGQPFPAPAVINSQADFDAVCNIPIPTAAGKPDEATTPGVRRAYVVQQINFCGSASSNIVGCANTPGTCMVIVRISASFEGQLWAHEYGHTKGLQHRSDSQALMNPTILTTTKGLTNDECNIYRQP